MSKPQIQTNNSNITKRTPKQLIAQSKQGTNQLTIYSPKKYNNHHHQQRNKVKQNLTKKLPHPKTRTAHTTQISRRLRIDFRSRL